MITLLFFINIEIGGYVGEGGPVQYVDELPTIDFVKDDFTTKHVKNIFYKESKWDLKKSIACIQWWPQTATTEQRNVKLPKDCVIEIILGEFMPRESKEEIKKIAKEKYPKAKLIENE